MTQRHGLHDPSAPPDLELGSLAIWVRGDPTPSRGDSSDELTMNAQGQLDVIVDLTADPLVQRHH